MCDTNQATPNPSYQGNSLGQGLSKQAEASTQKMAASNRQTYTVRQFLLDNLQRTAAEYFRVNAKLTSMSKEDLDMPRDEYEQKYSLYSPF